MADLRKRKAPRRDRRGMSTLAAGTLAVVIAIVGLYFGFSKHVPFTHGFRLNAVAESANSLRKDSFVRIAGINVGKVKSIKPFGDGRLSEITMEIQKNGLPIHKDATMTIRPRIFLEGNFFVDLKPGTPSSPTLHDNDTLPATQTSAPVQLDQVLTALQSDTRKDLQDLLKGYGQALDQKPKPGSDSGQDPEVQGLTGAQALRKSTQEAPEALKTTAQVNEALLGEEPHDLSRIIASVAKVSGALESREVQLKDLVTNFNTTMAATAAESDALQAAVRELSPTLDAGDRAFAALNRAFPPTRAFAREVLPGVHETAATINASFPWIRQTKALLGPKELQGVARELRPTIRSSSKLIDDTTRLLPQVDLVQRCIKDVVLPSGNVVVKDPVKQLNTGAPNYKEFLWAMVGIAGEGQNFDGNGQYVRFQPGGGLDTINLGKSTLGQDALIGQSAESPVATAPTYPGKRPAYHPEVPCYTNGPLTDAKVNGPAAAGPADNVTGRRPPTTSAVQDLLNNVTDLLPANLISGLTGGGLPLSRRSARATPRSASRSGGGAASSPTSPSSGGTPSARAGSTSSSSRGASTTPTSPAPSTSSTSSSSSSSSLAQKVLGSLNPLQNAGGGRR